MTKKARRPKRAPRRLRKLKVDQLTKDSVAEGKSDREAGILIRGREKEDRRGRTGYNAGNGRQDAG